MPQSISFILNWKIKDNNYWAIRRLNGRQWLLQLLYMAYSFAQVVQVSTELALYCSGMESVRCPFLEGTHWFIQTEAQKICCLSSREWWDLDNSPRLWNVLMGVWMHDEMSGSLLSLWHNCSLCCYTMTSKWQRTATNNEHHDETLRNKLLPLREPSLSSKRVSLYDKNNDNNNNKKKTEWLLSQNGRWWRVIEQPIVKIYYASV